MKIHEIIIEAFDEPYPITVVKDPDSSQYDLGGGDYSGITTLSDGTRLEVNFFDDDTGGETYQVEFRRGGSQGLTGRGDSQRVFATVLSAIKQFIQLADPDMISFVASKNPDKQSNSRANLYTRMVKRYAAKWGYSVYIEDQGDALIFELTKNPNHGMANESQIPTKENFAEGKNTLYHATYKPLLKNIQARGLGGSGAQTQYPDSKPGVVYLAKDPEVAISHAETNDIVPDEWIDNIVVLAVDIDNLDPDKLHDDENIIDDYSTMEYHGVIKNFSLEENFADGKVKGKSRPGRVKRAGASCKGSVTHLRKMAKKYSGERGKMYHWCANMKAGKKK